MRVTWTVPVQIDGYNGPQVLCRSEEEAANLVLELFLAGVPRRCIIVDGVNQERSDFKWLFAAKNI